MKNKKIMALAVALMAIGFASVSTVLYLNGQTFIAGNDDDFVVYYSRALEDGVDKTSEVIKDKTHIEFTTELTGVNDKYVLDYDVTNGSKQYDANIVMNCIGGNEYLRVENKFDTTKILPARTTRSGVLTLTVIKVPLTEMSVSISCEISGNAVERAIVGGDAIEVEKVDYLKQAEKSYNSPTYLGHELDRKKVESITFKDSKEIPEGVESWDVSNSENGSILAYTLDEDNNDLLELYIGQNGGVNANLDSSRLFYEFRIVKEITGLENLDTSNVMNMSWMFHGCCNLTNLNISEFDTSKVTDMSYMFYDCGALTILDVSSFDTINVTNMNGMFGSCKNLINLDVSKWNTSKVTNMISLFSFCSNLTNLNVSKFDTSKVTNMRDMFSHCSNLTNLNVSRFDTSKVTDMSYMFYYCSALTSLDVSSFDTINVTNMNGMFGSCKNLINLDVSGFNTNKVINMAQMFSYCSNLTNLNVSRFVTNNVTSMSQMFYYCSSLTNLDVSGFDTSHITDMGSMFTGCNNLTTIITIRGIKCTSYSGMFSSSATSDGAQITVNYTEDVSDLVDQMIATKSSNSNVIKGTVVA